MRTRWTKAIVLLPVLGATPAMARARKRGEMVAHVAFLSPAQPCSRSSRVVMQSAAGALDCSTLGPDQSTAQKDWSPRSRHWLNEDFFKQETAVQLGLDLDGSLEDSINAEETDTNEPVVTTMHRNKDGRIIAVEVASALAEHELATVQALSCCIREHDIGESQFENRSFGDGKGGNDCIYLAPLLQVFRHAVAAQVISTVRLAWKAGSWDVDGYPDPLSLGIRTSEHLSYKGWRSLEAHKDVGSTYTVMVSIAAPQDYEGGEFFIQNSFYECTDIKPNRCSAIVFLSDTTHGVRPITSGHRESFVTELWTNDDSPLGMNRPTVERWENFVADQESA